METVGLFGYTESDPRVARIRAKRVQKVVWVVECHQPEKVLDLLHKKAPEILVLNPRWSGLLKGKLDRLPRGTRVVEVANPFGPDSIMVPKA